MSSQLVTDVAAVGGVLVSLFVGVLAYLPSRRRHPTRTEADDTVARDRLIDQLQERIDQQDRQLSHCEDSHAHTRAVLANTLNQLDDLRLMYQNALHQLDELANQIIALSQSHKPHDGEA